MQSDNRPAANDCKINVHSKTPRLVCSMILGSPPSLSSKTVLSCYDNIVHDFTTSNFEASFMRQNMLRGGKHFRSSSSMSMTNSRYSGHSIGTNLTNISASSTVEMGSSTTLKRSGSFSSTSSVASTQVTPHNSSVSTNRPTAGFALPVNGGSTPIKIAFQEYLLVPTSDARVLVYQIIDFLLAESFMQEAELNGHAINRNESFFKHLANNRKMSSKLQQEKQSVLPILAIGPFRIGDHSKSLRVIADKSQLIPASIVDMCVCDGDTNSQFSPSLGNVAILTQDGGVHIYEFFMLQQSNVGHDGESPQLKVKHVHSFVSGNISSTTIAMHRNLTESTVAMNGQILRHHQAEFSITIGFEGGGIAEFTIIDRQHKLRWRGSVGFPVQSLAYINPENSSNFRSNGSDGISLHRDNLFLVIGTSENPVHASKKQTQFTFEEIVSSCLDIISVADAEKEWTAKFRGVSRRSSSSTIELSDISIWPTNSISGKEGFQIPLPEQKMKQNNSGIKEVCSIEVMKGGVQGFSTLLGNGALATFHYQMHHSKGLCWDLQHKNNHVMMPFSSFAGAGLFDVEPSSPNSQSIACCLRGGTAIVVPIKHAETESSHPNIFVYSTPFDSAGIDDDSVRFVQGFTAGNIRVKSWGQSSPLEPTLRLKMYFQAWSCGTIDCYTCDLQDRSAKNSNARISQVYRHLLSNGALGMLTNHLSLDQSQLEAGSLLSQASQEYKKTTYSDADLLDRIISGDSDIPSTRELLHRLLTGSRF